PVRAGMRGYGARWEGMTRRYSHAPAQTGVPYETLVTVAEGMARLPDTFTPHPKVARLLEARRDEIQARRSVDWGRAEGVAFGPLLGGGRGVGRGGEDSRGGTFSQRHAVLYDARTGERHLPLKALAADRASFAVYDSLLSEAAVLGFEFGFS